MSPLLDVSDRMSVAVSAAIGCDAQVRAFRDWYDPAEWGLEVETEPYWRVVCAVRWNGHEYGVQFKEGTFDESLATRSLSLAIKDDMGLLE